MLVRVDKQLNGYYLMLPLVVLNFPIWVYTEVFDF